MDSLCVSVLNLDFIDNYRYFAGVWKFVHMEQNKHTQHLTRSTVLFTNALKCEIGIAARVFAPISFNSLTNCTIKKIIKSTYDDGKYAFFRKLIIMLSKCFPSALWPFRMSIYCLRVGDAFSGKKWRKKYANAKIFHTKEKKPKERNFLLMEQTTTDEFFTRSQKMKAYMVVDAFFFFRICTKWLKFW